MTGPADDVFGCLSQLREALEEPALQEFSDGGDPGRTAGHAAWILAVAIGECRLFNIDAGALDGTLPPEMAVAATVEMIESITESLDDVNRLGDRWDAAAHPVERDDLCLAVLQARMDAWSAYVAVDESLFAADERGLAINPEAGDLLATAYRRIEELDRELQTEEDLLSSVARIPLIRNWKILVADFCEGKLPWWLDGRLEATAEWIAAENENDAAQLWQAISTDIRRAAVKPALPIRIPFQTTIVQTAAHDGKKHDPPAGYWEWEDPGQTFQATMRFPGEAKDGDADWLLLQVTDGVGGDFRVVAGRFRDAELSGVTAELSETGELMFRLKDIRSAVAGKSGTDEPSLKIDGVVWTFLP